MLTGRRLPRHSPNAIKAEQAGFRAQPEITVRSLGDRVNRPLAKPSRTVQAVWAYWLISSEGSNAMAQTLDASSTASPTMALARGFVIPGDILVQPHPVRLLSSKIDSAASLQGITGSTPKRSLRARCCIFRRAVKRTARGVGISLDDTCFAVLICRVLGLGRQDGSKYELGVEAFERTRLLWSFFRFADRPLSLSVKALQHTNPG